MICTVCFKIFHIFFNLLHIRNKNCISKNETKWQNLSFYLKNDSILNISTISDKPKSLMQIFKSRKVFWNSERTCAHNNPGQSWERRI